MGSYQLSSKMALLQLYRSYPRSNSALQIDPETRPSTIGPPFTGHFRMAADTPRGLQPFQAAQNSQPSAEGKSLPATEKAVSSSATPKTETKSLVSKNIYDSNTSKQVGDSSQSNGLPEEEKKKYFCYSCGVNCTRVKYQSAKAAKKFDLCPNCFLEGRFPQNHASGDFFKVEDTGYQAVDRDAPWTPQETLALLEGLEQYVDDWNKIAEHVGTRTREQCVYHFLGLPIEDKHLEQHPEQLGPLQYDRIPFSQADNPVVSVVAFLASLVDPKVAAAAAQSSVDEMTKTLKSKLEIAGKQTKQQEKKDDKAEPAATPAAGGPSASSPKETADVAKGAMDVDEPTTSTEIVKKDSTAIDQMASVALAVSSARACGLASNEEREMMRLVGETINANLRKLDLKLQHFQEMENLLIAERRELEKQKQQLFLDRLAMKKQVGRAVEALKQAKAKEAGPATTAILDDVSAMNFGAAPGAGVDGKRTMMFPQGSDATTIAGPAGIPPSQVEGGTYVPFEA